MRMNLCCTGCAEPFPDCFGCPVLEVDIPTAWQMDFPAPMTYAAATSGSCSHTSAEYPELFSTYPARKDFFEHSYSYPSMAGFGDATILEIDDATVASPSYSPSVQCIWASGDFEMYEFGWHASVRNDSSPFGCNGSAFKLANFSASDPWVYGLTGYSGIPTTYSPNRVRTMLTTTDSRCGTAPCLGPFGSTPQRWVCGFRASGVWALLQIVEFNGNKFVAVSIFWIPERWTKAIRQRKPLSTTPLRPDQGYEIYNETPPQDVSFLLASGSAINTALLSTYTEATAVSNLWQGLILRYEKQVNCATDFDGTPITLNLAQEYKRTPGATQTICEAAGITDIPSTITITPL